MKLKPKTNNTKLLVLYRVLAVITFLVCLLVIATQATALFENEYSFLFWVRNSPYEKTKRYRLSRITL